MEHFNSNSDSFEYKQSVKLENQKLFLVEKTYYDLPNPSRLWTQSLHLTVALYYT